MVTVYYARVLDTERIETIVTAHKGTREWISKLPEGEPNHSRGDNVERLRSCSFNILHSDVAQCIFYAPLSLLALRLFGYFHPFLGSEVRRMNSKVVSSR
jgi:hypothetical protein